ncbi:Momilactone A synthase [Acorus calamus]|uniref:Momilactone A synthase n=1 Tax=Acorus calamus TaxID=4465 RepID=A0AAV9EE60_ACOCL|nr:Momilactone A synthase [Acorus calamus]
MGSISALPAAARRLQGKVALITGGASGIGEATARLFSAHGAKVVIADIQDGPGRSVSADLGGPSNCLYLRCDVTEESDIRDAVDATVSTFGGLDVMHNNAGTMDPYSPLAEIEKSRFERVLAVNLTGCFLGTKHAARVMVPKRRGSIVMTASTSAVTGVVGMSVTPAYTASKHGLLGLMRHAACELGRFGVRVNCVSPYGLATPLAKKVLCVERDAEVEEAFGRYTALKGVALRAVDVAHAALYLASEEAKYMSGHNLVVDGGFTSSVCLPSDYSFSDKK